VEGLVETGRGPPYVAVSPIDTLIQQRGCNGDVIYRFREQRESATVGVDCVCIRGRQIACKEVMSIDVPSCLACPETASETYPICNDRSAGGDPRFVTRRPTACECHLVTTVRGEVVETGCRC